MCLRQQGPTRNSLPLSIKNRGKLMQRTAYIGKGKAASQTGGCKAIHLPTKELPPSVGSRWELEPWKGPYWFQRLFTAQREIAWFVHSSCSFIYGQCLPLAKASCKPAHTGAGEIQASGSAADTAALQGAEQVKTKGEVLLAHFAFLSPAIAGECTHSRSNQCYFEWSLRD